VEKKRPWWASGTESKSGSADLAFEVEEDTFEIGLIEDLFLLGNAQQQGITADVVDLASHTLGMVVDAAEEAVAEELPLVASDAKVVLDVPGSLFEVKGPEVVADGDSLVEGFVGCEAELVGQVRLPKEDEGQWGSGIHVVVEQEAELVQELG